MARPGHFRQFWTVVFFLCVTSIRAFPATERNLITTNMLGLAVGIYSLTYEVAIGGAMSLSVGVFGGGIKDPTQWEKFAVNSGIGVVWHFYTGDTVLRGFYLGPTVAFAWLDLDHVDSPPVKGEVSVVGCNMGYRWVLGNGLTLGVEAGIGYLAGRVFTDAAEVPFGDLVPTNASVNIGFAF